MNIPGDPLSPGCNYSKAFKALKDTGEGPADHLRPHCDERRATPGLVVQYWFFYYFNQFNDLHEGDWEGMQIAFDENTPREALATGPSEIALFQHERRREGLLGRAAEGPEGGHPPGRLPGGGLSRHVLLVGHLRRERAGRFRPRVRQHDLTGPAGKSPSRS